MMAMESGTATLEKRWAVSYTVKHVLSIQCRNSNPEYLPSAQLSQILEQEKLVIESRPLIARG